MPSESRHSDASLKPIAFFCRAKPQGADALRICKKAGRIFIGYPLLRKGETYNPGALGRCLVDPTCPDKEWAREIAGQSNARSYNRNRNFIPLVTPGSIVVIPRPEQGAVYSGRIVGRFEIVDSPLSKRGDTYLRTLLIHGARTVLNKAKAPPVWALRLAERRPANVVVVALANKTARTIWALLAHDRTYQPTFVSQAA